MYTCCWRLLTTGPFASWSTLFGTRDSQYGNCSVTMNRDAQNVESGTPSPYGASVCIVRYFSCLRCKVLCLNLTYSTPQNLCGAEEPALSHWLVSFWSSSGKVVPSSTHLNMDTWEGYSELTWSPKNSPIIFNCVQRLRVLTCKDLLWTFLLNWVRLQLELLTGL